jgi:translocation and assembly module TamB
MEARAGKLSFRPWQLWLLGALTAFAIVVAGAFLWLDSASGHRFIVNQISKVTPKSGLRISVGGIEGSVFKNAQIHDLRLSDPKGVFLSAPQVALKWWPLAWITNRLEIDGLIVPQAHLHKIPKLNPADPDSPILPNFDIRIMQLSVENLTVDPSVTGKSNSIALAGDVDIRSGRAVVELSGRARGSEDRLVLSLDSRPDDGRFDADITINAPRDGVLAAMAGLKKDANIRLKGDGDWFLWNGSLVATLDQQPAAGFSLKAQDGRYSLVGKVLGAALGNAGILPRIASPDMRIEAQGTFTNRLLSGTADISSAVMKLRAVGGMDLRRNAYDNMTVDAHLVQPLAVSSRLGGRDLMGRFRIDGPFATAGFEYLATASAVQIDKSILRQIKVKGTGYLGGADKPTLIPVDLTMEALDGRGPLLASIIAHTRVSGVLQAKDGLITSTPMVVRTDKLNGTLKAKFSLADKRYELALDSMLRQFAIQGLGIVDVRSALVAAPDTSGALGVTGVAQADMLRMDNSFLRDLSGGLPKVSSKLSLGRDGIMRFADVTMRSPLLQLRGNGERASSGEIRFAGAGAHGRYGPLKIALAGKIERPKVDLLLYQPSKAAGLTNVHVLLDPDNGGYLYRANGGSQLGPFTSQGRIALPRGGQTLIEVARLEAGGAIASGIIRPVAGGLTGRLAVAGPLSGSVDLVPVNGVQQIAAKLEARDARFAGPMTLAIRRGTLDAIIVLDPTGTSVDATVRARGVQYGKLRINQIAANANMVDGAGKLKASLSGQRGRLFQLQVDADIAPRRWLVNLGGTLDSQPVRLSNPAQLAQDSTGGWTLQPVTVNYRGGSATISGVAGGAQTRVDMSLARIPLTLLDLGNLDWGLGGNASGQISFEQRKGGTPSGLAKVQIRGLTRSGVTRTSEPIDMGLNGILSGDRLAVRAMASSSGKVIGRAQALITPLGRGSFMDRVQYAPLQAQVRFSGPAAALWRLTGIEIVDLEGNVAAGANMQGTLAAPVIAGAVSTSNAALTSPVTGMRLSNFTAAGRFNGSQLVLNSISGTARNGGQVTGRGTFDISSVQGVAMDIALQANNAELLNRDDLGATVTGPITIRSSGNGGVIGGQFEVVRSRFSLGRAAAVAQIPQLKITNKNQQQEDFDPIARAEPWSLDMHARARNRLMVDGLGLNSEWSMDMAIGGTVLSPRLVGTARMIRGSYDFAGRRFDMTTGSLLFDGRTPANPTLDITAEASLTDLSATIRVTGTSLNPIINFTSVPALPNDEVLSRILFGSSITQLSAPEALQLASAVASLQGKGGGLDPINAVRKAAGLDRLRILPADTITGRGTSLAAGKFITRKTYVELISDGQGYSATRIEYQVTRWLSLLASISTIGRQSASVRVSKDY